MEKPWIICRTSCDGIGNVMKAFISALSVNPLSRVQTNPDYSLGHYELVLHPRHVHLGEIEGDAEPFYTCRLLVLTDEENDQPYLADGQWNVPPFTTGNPKLDACDFFSKRSVIDWNYSNERLCAQLCERVDRVTDSIEFLPEITERVEQTLRNFQGLPLLGVSVRTWKAPHEKNINRAYDPNVYMKAIVKELPNVAGVFISVDHHEEAEIYASFLRDKAANVNILEWKDCDPLQEAFLKALVLSRCQVVVGSRQSTFLELVYWFSKRKARIVPLF